MSPSGWSSAAARAVVAALAVCALAPAGAHAAVSPPTAAAFFSQSPVMQATPVGFGVTIANTAATPLTGVGVAVTLPAGLVVATPGQPFSSCAGTFAAADGGRRSACRAAGWPRPGTRGITCLLTVDVVSAQTGTYNVQTGAPTSTESGPGSLSNTAHLTVSSGAASAPDRRPADGRRGVRPPRRSRSARRPTLAYTLANPNAGDVLYNVNLDDTLPAGLSVATPSNITDTCTTGDLVANPATREFWSSGSSWPVAPTAGSGST